MNLMRSDAWTRRGISLVWDATALGLVARPDDVLSLRQFVALTKDWPAELPSNQGNALVVAGLEGCLDLLTIDDAEAWLAGAVKQAVLGFQEEYSGQGALIFWLPTGRSHVHMKPASEHYVWKPSTGSHDGVVALRALFGGAESDIERILFPADRVSDPHGPAWVGVHLARIS